MRGLDRRECPSRERCARDARGLDRACCASGSRKAGPRHWCARAVPAPRGCRLSNMKRAKGIYRPALAIPLPVPGCEPARPGGDSVILLDVGANAEARREHLVQFAFMGAALASAVLGVERPRVGLLSMARSPRVVGG